MRTSLLMLVIVTAAACAPSAGDAPGVPGAARIRAVTDGDTIEVEVAGATENVRLIGIDTPETHGPGGLRECFGAEASARTTELLPAGSTVQLVRDVEARDRYGRLLAYVYRDDGLFVNLALAAEGFAAPLSIEPNVAYEARLAAAVAAARSAGRGLWSACGDADTPVRPRRG